VTIKYVLLTAARNEADYIRKTLESVVTQTIRPQRWLIVDDGSTDSTGDIIRDYADNHKFIQLITRDGDEKRNFASKSRAVDYAYEQIKDLDFDYVGNLDADIGLTPTYYENILRKMEANPQLGLAGGIRYDYKNGKFELLHCARNSVGGPIQLFHRDCFEAIGGYMALPYGGIDAVAEISARMHGWEVRSFPEFRVYHYRATGTANRSIWNALFRAGIRDYTIGYHPLFQFARMLQSLRHKPYILGAIVKMAGYLTAMLRREKRPVSQDLIAFLHKEQLNRLKTNFPLQAKATKLSKV
jgi:poly-beta-1,6-N-acetyl-D-glucosamine synthase